MDRDELEVEGPLGLNARVKGPITTLALLVIVCASSLGWLVWNRGVEDKQAHTEQKQSVDELKNSVAEMVYVLSLPQEQREKLKLTMPESLRHKIRRERGEE